MDKKVLSLKQMTTIGVLSAIIILLGWTPIGMIPLGGAASATITHIPVIIGALVMGPRVGFTLGAVMGLTSLTRAVIAPQSPVDLMFMNPIISIVPRLFIGILAYYVYQLLKKYFKTQFLCFILAGIVGSLTNTLFTLGVIFLMGNGQTLALAGSSLTITKALIGGAILFNGIPEAVITPLLTAPIATAIKRSKIF